MEHTLNKRCKSLIWDIFFVTIGYICLLCYDKYKRIPSIYDLLFSLSIVISIFIISFYPIRVNEDKRIYENKKALIPYIIITAILQILIYTFNKEFGINNSSGFLVNRNYVYLLKLGITATLFISYLFKIKFKNFNWDISFKFLILVIILYLVHILIPNINIILNSKMHFSNISNMKLIPNFIRNAALESIYPGIFEEVLNRGLLISGLKGYGISDEKCNIIQAVLFGIGHVGSWGTASLIFLLSTAAQAMAGYILGKVYFKTKSLVPCIILHGLLDVNLYNL